MNTKAFGETIHDVASSIANSKWAKAIIPTTEELNETMLKNISSSKNYLDDQARAGGEYVLKAIGGLSDDKAKAIASSISSKNIDESIDALKDKIVEAVPDGKDIDKIIAGMKKKAALNVEAEPNLGDVMQKIQKMGKFEKYSHYPKAYFTNPDKDIRNTRIGTAVGGYAALTVGGRYLSGGTLTTDNYGRGDIAGVPFL